MVRRRMRGGGDFSSRSGMTLREECRRVGAGRASVVCRREEVALDRDADSDADGATRSSSSSSPAPRSLQLSVLLELLEVGECMLALPPDETPRPTLITRSEPELTVNVALLAQMLSATRTLLSKASWSSQGRGVCGGMRGDSRHGL